MIDVRGKNVYLSGPMTGIEHNNVAAFAVAHDELKRRSVGYVFNPAVRYLVTGAQRLEEMGHEDFMTDTIHELTAREARDQRFTWLKGRKYDMVIMLDGWQGSGGARMERSVALACGIPVYELSEVME